MEIEQQSTEVPVVAPIKGIKGKRGRKPGRKPKSQEDAQEVDVSEFAVDNEEEEPAAEIAPKSEEELKQKGEASSSFEQLAKQFAAFRQRLVNESLASAEHELQLLNQPDCVHPEYLRQVSCIDERKAKQEREANAYYRYRIQAVRERTLGERAQLHSQYFQTARELRENMLYALGEDWYGIQKERRQQHQEGEERFLYKLPSKKSAQIRQQAKYNQEVSVLSGIAKYVGFPAAPNISGVEGLGLEDDFKAMRVSKTFPLGLTRFLTDFPDTSAYAPACAACTHSPATAHTSISAAAAAAAASNTATTGATTAAAATTSCIYTTTECAPSST
jgi:hypothetical protein